MYHSCIFYLFVFVFVFVFFFLQIEDDFELDDVEKALQEHLWGTYKQKDKSRDLSIVSENSNLYIFRIWSIDLLNVDHQEPIRKKKNIILFHALSKEDITIFSSCIVVKLNYQTAEKVSQGHKRDARNNYLEIQ